jgi:hypoxanthine phosphoribosyltransferase
MEKIKIGFNEIENIISHFVSAEKDLLEEIDFVVGISRGGLVPAALLAAKIDKPLATVYIDKNDKIYFDRQEWIKGKNILVVDDIIRSGKTLKLIRTHFEKNAEPASMSFFALFRVTSLGQLQFNIEALAKDVNNDVIFPWDNLI